jgi:hypothetical protein
MMQPWMIWDLERQREQREREAEVGRGLWLPLPLPEREPPQDGENNSVATLVA